MTKIQLGFDMKNEEMGLYEKTMADLVGPGLADNHNWNINQIGKS